ncbi:MAG: TspO protein [Elusimicrobia bacterium RIFOXYA2_FULL_39_19]|nr:MAG: TspO protein [Elusimicrobia bacterium RIFOXYA2_FULL_39_19]
MALKNSHKLLIFLGIAYFAEFVGSAITIPMIDTWYVTLNKPMFNPPSWVFAPTWTLLYSLMGIASYLVWQKDINRKLVRTALLIFYIQLALNVLWSFLFFGMLSLNYAFVEILILWIFILITIIYFLRISGLAGVLLIPYLIWVSYAALLNYSFWMLNR